MVRRIAKETLDVLGCPDAELSISLVSDRKITALNHQYLQRHRPTDVLSFPMGEGDFSDINPHLLGDVVISAETAKRQADSKGHSFEEELCFLLLHGMLHLLGYDHEAPGSDARAMRRQERTLLRQIKEKGIIVA
ncbi:MAG: rRNA maturation RNase YbeY [Deltaproteobacteria bacterium]|nr:rRNA maturation RNase YbeY [Deltaproteobacteria bacterium]